MNSTYWYESQEGPTPWWPEADGEGLTDCGDLGQTIGTDGAAITTVEDMDAFYRGLFGERLLSRSALDQMLTMDSELFEYRFGLGLLEMVDASSPDDVMYGFGGSGETYGTRAFHDPATGRTIVVFTTGDDLLWEVVEWANQVDG